MWFEKFHAGDTSLGNAPQSGRPVEVGSYQTETLIENNHHYTTWDLYSKYPNQALKSICTSLVMLITLMAWVPYKVSEKNFVDYISAGNLYLNITKTFHF